MKINTERSLKIRVTKAKKALIACQGSLADKIVLKYKVRQAEKNLHDFKLNYFEHNA